MSAPVGWRFLLLRRATDWAKVYRLLDNACLPADGVIRSMDQLVTRPAAYWQESWLPRFQGPDELTPVFVFEQRLRAALAAST
mgnify:CR=1 FL=1